MRSLHLVVKRNGKSEKVPLPNLTAVIERYGRELEKGIKQDLIASGKEATGELVNSVQFVDSRSDVQIDIPIGEGDIAFGISFGGARYWEYVEKGVRGSVDDSKAPKSPFQYSKYPPSDSIAGWVNMKGISGWRTAQGKIMTESQIVYVITRSIYLRGIEPTDYIQPTLNAVTGRYEPKFADAFRDDLQEQFDERLPDHYNFDI